MSKIKILLDGNEINELTLLKGREYIIGRSERCDIVLDKSSVSRQHLKLIFDGEKWQIQILSRFSTVFIDNQEAQQVNLTKTVNFYVEGFEFRFIYEETVLKKEEKPNTYVPTAGSLLNPEVSLTNVPAHLDHDEKTSVVSTVGEPCLFVSNEGTGEETLFTLEGNSWTVGRSSICQIQINEPKSSRNHFEVARTTVGFEIKDLGSANGTYINGERLEPQARVKLQAGDQIRVGHTVIEFQIRDPNFEAKLNEIPDHLLSDETRIQLERPPLSTFPDFSGQFPQHTGGHQMPSNVVPYNQQRHPYLNKKNYIRGAIALVTVFIIYGASQEEHGELDQTSIPANAGRPDNENMDHLTKDQKKFLENTHKLAKSLYIQGKYDSALIEIKKIHAIVPFYDDSKEIELYSQQAVEIKLQQQEINDRAQEAQAIKDKVGRIVETCETKYTPSTKMEQLQQCLAPALELDPENTQALALLGKATKTEEERIQRQQNKENLQARIRTGNNMYQTARNAEQAGRLLDAIAAYERYMSSGYPDPQDNKPKARQAIAQLRSKIKADIQARLSMAEKFKSEEKFKDALKALARAIELDPSASSARSLYDTVQDDLNRKMKALYSDSVIEENLGNIEAAKQKWRIIKDQDIEGGNYYMKSTRKLNRYEK